MTKFDALIRMLEVVAAGFFGSLVSLMFHPDARDFAARTLLVSAGTVTAYYVGPLVIGYFGISPSLGSGISFLVGAFGMSLAAAVMRGISNADLWALIRSRLGGDTK